MYLREANRSEVPELHAGDIGAIAKLTSARTGDTLSTKATPIRYGKTEYFHSLYIQDAIRAKNKGDEDKVAQALAEDDATKI